MLGRSIFAAIGGAIISSCSATPAPQESEFDSAALDYYVPQLLTSERAAGVGIAVVRNGQTVWTGYYGEQGPGEPVNAQTVFNVASVAKTLAAETMIRLATSEGLDLDATVANEVMHPELSDDPRYRLLTPRILMSHRAGLLNWGHQYEDGRIAFDHDPDQSFSYSGAGVELAADYAEAVTGETYPQLVERLLWRTPGIEEMSLGQITPWMESRLATQMDAEGMYRSASELNPGLAANANSAADDLLTTLPAYARFLEDLIARAVLDSDANTLRETVLTTLEQDPIYHCEPQDGLRCPDQYGHSIGWHAFHYGEHVVIMHSGSDAGENAFVYYSPSTQTGAAIFVNGANGWIIMTRIIELIGDEPDVAAYYRSLIERFFDLKMSPLDVAAFSQD